MRRTKENLDQDKLRQKLFTFGRRFVSLYGGSKVTPYLHILICHSNERIKRFEKLGVSVSNMSAQGIEAGHKYEKRIWERASSIGGGFKSSRLQTVEYIYRVNTMKLHLKYGENMREKKNPKQWDIDM